MVLALYGGGMSEREISSFMDEKYNLYYSPTTISNMTKSLVNRTEEFHTRRLQKKYAVIYLDATFVPVRRDTSNKEALHVVVGVEPNGTREVLDAVLFPTEAATNYEELLRRLKRRGVEQVLLFISDGLKGMRDAVKRVFPKAEHQSCWVHLSRTVCRLIRNKDRKEILGDLRTIYTQDSAEKARMELGRFLEKHSGKYPKLSGVFSNTESLFSYYSFPKSIRASIYTSNLIENNNKGLKRKTKVKEQFPNEDALDQFVCCYYSEYNRKSCQRAHKGFKEAEAELLAMFDEG